MAYIVMSDHYWGTGPSEKAARAAWREAGGRGSDVIVCRIHDGYVEPWVDEMGRIWADAGPLLADVVERPPVVVECWRVGPGTKRVALDPRTGEVAA